MSNVTAEQLEKKLNSLLGDVSELLERYRTVKRINAELLEACKEMLAHGGTTPGEWCPADTYNKMLTAILNAGG